LGNKLAANWDIDSNNIYFYCNMAYLCIIVFAFHMESIVGTNMAEEHSIITIDSISFTIADFSIGFSILHHNFSTSFAFACSCYYK
jgi:hypothetical protein